MEGEDIPQIVHQLNNAGGYDDINNLSWRWQSIKNVDTSVVTKTKVYTKYFTGTLNVALTTNVPHGENFDKILPGTVAFFYNDTNSNYYVSEMARGADATISSAVRLDATNIILANVGTNFQGHGYKIKMEYYL